MMLDRSPPRARQEDAGSKPVILAFTGYYLPGYKAGGILRNILNTTDNLCGEFEFWIVTRDRDLGDTVPYVGIVSDRWQNVGNAMVYYLSPKSNSLRGVRAILGSTPHNILYLNSYFEPLTIKVLLNRKFRMKNAKPVIVAPFGEFAWASLGQKYFKKFLFMRIARLIGLYKNVTWRVSSDFEAADVINVLKIPTDAIHVTGDLPIKELPSIDVDTAGPAPHRELRIVFLSRISREKNLDFALRVLGKVQTQVIFDIYGPAENSSYWQECRELITKLPMNVVVNYLGSVSPDKVMMTFSRYDLFLFPTGGEAYGNTIAECLTTGTPVLISTATPWRDLQTDGLGWDIDLDRIDQYVNIIDTYSLTSNEQRAEKRTIVKSGTLKRMSNPNILESNRQLFLKQL